MTFALNNDVQVELMNHLNQDQTDLESRDGKSVRNSTDAKNSTKKHVISNILQFAAKQRKLPRCYIAQYISAEHFLHGANSTVRTAPSL